MSAWLCIFAFGYFCLSSSFVYGKVTDERKEELRQLVKSGNLADGSRTEQQYYARWIMSLSTEERAALIPIVQQHRDKIHRSLAEWREEWNGLLAYLGDDEAMKANIDYWRRVMPTGSLTVIRAESGQLPIYLEPEIFLEEVHQGYGDTNAVSTSFMVASFVLGYLQYNRHYPQEVRDWAGRTHKSRQGFEDPTPMRNVTRAWYRANEAFIRAKQYDKVKLGEELPARANLSEKSGRVNGPSQPILEGRQDQNSAPKSAPVPLAPEPDRKTPGNYVIFAIVSAVLAAVIFFLWNRRSRKQ